jgi:hypothetical protein
MSGALTQAGGAVGQMAAILQEGQNQIDKTRAEDAYTQLQSRRIDLTIGDEGFKKLKGVNAVKSKWDDWNGKYDSAIDEIANGLDNDDQKRAFKERAESSRLQYKSDYQSHYIEEDQAHQGQVYQSTKEVETNIASMSWNKPDAALASIVRIKAIAGDYADSKGMEGVVREAEITSAVSGAHAVIIGNAIDAENPEYAKLWMKTHRKEIDASTAEELENALEVSEDRIKAQQTTDKIMAMGLSKADAKRYAEKNLTGKDRDEVKTRLDSRYADIEEEITLREDDAEDAAWDIVLADKTVNGILPTEFVKLSDDAKKRILAYDAAQRTKEKRKDDDYAVLDEVELAIEQGDITETDQIRRYEPFLRDSTIRTLRKKIDKRGTVKATVMRRSFEDRVGETRAGWSKEQQEQWLVFQDYILDNVKETKRPEDLDVWADQWFMEGYTLEDRWGDDPDTFGEAVTQGRADFLITTPEYAQTEVQATLGALRYAYNS